MFSIDWCDVCNSSINELLISGDLDNLAPPQAHPQAHPQAQAQPQVHPVAPPRHAFIAGFRHTGMPFEFVMLQVTH